MDTKYPNSLNIQPIKYKIKSTINGISAEKRISRVKSIKKAGSFDVINRHFPVEVVPKITD